MDCAAGLPPSPLALPVFVCSAEASDLGSPEGELLEAILAGAPFPVDRARSRILARGKDALPEALTLIGRLLAAREAAGCYLVGADNLIAPKRLRRLARAGAVVDGVNSDGFVPGEGAAALLLVAHADRATKALIAGVGSARDAGLAKGEAATGQAIGQALDQALADARLKPAQLSAVGPRSVRTVCVVRGAGPGGRASAAGRAPGLEDDPTGHRHRRDRGRFGRAVVGGRRVLPRARRGARGGCRAVHVGRACAWRSGRDAGKAMTGTVVVKVDRG